AFLGSRIFSQQPAEMSLTLSYFSILNYIQKGNLPASAGSRSVGGCYVVLTNPDLVLGPIGQSP
ncbi:MAG: hypothetical protein ACI85V_001829, partial [bacterium]